MGSDELIINLFRISQTNQKLEKDKVNNQKTANQILFRIGKNIRDVIEKNEGIMPEELPTPKKSIKELEKNSKGLRK